MPWASVLLRRRIARRGCDIPEFTDEDVGFCKGVGMWHPGLQMVPENLRISQTRQKSYATVPFFSDLWKHLSGVSSNDAWEVLSNKIELYIVRFFSLPWPYQSVFPLYPSSDVGRTKRPWRQCNGWWCSCNSLRGAADDVTRSVFANNIPSEEWREKLPVLPILRHPLSSISCNWRWSYN